MLRTQPLFRDDGMMIGDLLPANPSQFDIGSPTLPIRNVYADNIIGAITTLANGEWIQGLDSGGVAIDLLRIDATNDTELNAKTGRSIQLQINNLTQVSLSSTGQVIFDNANVLDAFIGKNTADGSDTGNITLSSTSATGRTRGASLRLWGNNDISGFDGYAILSAGNGEVVGGELWLNAPNGSIRFQTGPAGIGETNRIILTGAGSINLDRTNTAAGTTGNQVIDKMAGSVNIAAAGTTITVTNALVTAASNIFAVVQTGDATALLKNVVPGAGSFVINMNAAVTAETRVAFWVTN